ncbi:MAG TPA: phosphodiesterase [Eggerthellaceae bacterium]|nr:phosphodiesterase [Eggerthellaceae bacterium]
MKLLIASDIHGSATWCERLMECFAREQPDQLVLLGDLLYHGPRNPLPEGYDPPQVAEMLNALADRIVAVRGNCDAEVDQMVLSFPCLADYALVLDGATRLYCTHGHLATPDDPPALPAGTIFLSGHTHVKADEVRNGVRFVNPGSIALPKDGTHSYALYDNGNLELCTTN